MKKKTGWGGLVKGLPVALFIFSGAMLTMGKGNLFELLISGALGALALAVSSVAARSALGNEEKSGFSRIFFVVLALITVTSSVYVAAISTREMMNFVRNVMLLRGAGLATGAVFVALCSYVASLGLVTVKKLSFIAALTVFASALFMLLLSFESFKLGRIEDLFASVRKISIEGVLRAFSLYFAPAVIAVIYISLEERASVASLFGGATATVLLLLCFLNVFLLLGSFGASEVNPYFTAVSTVTAGKLFARMEGFAYMMYYVAAFVRVSVCIALPCRLCEGIAKRKRRFLPYFMGLSVLLVTIVLSLS